MNPLFVAASQPSGSMTPGLIALAIGLACYFLPAFIAVLRWHRNHVAILVVNLFLGWTLVGWVVALAWSFTNDPKPPRWRERA